MSATVRDRSFEPVPRYSSNDTTYHPGALLSTDTLSRRAAALQSDDTGNAPGRVDGACVSNQVTTATCGCRSPSWTHPTGPEPPPSFVHSGGSKATPKVLCRRTGRRVGK